MLSATRSHFGEGETFVTATQVSTSADGTGSFAVTFPFVVDPTDVVTSTATNAAGATSEFSQCRADLSLVKSDAPDPVVVGETFTYTLDIANAGPAPAREVQVVDTLPLNVTLSAVAPSQGACTLVGRRLTCDLGLVARDGSASIKIDVVPQAGLFGNPPATAPSTTISNAATVTSELMLGEGGEDGDPDESNNTDVEATTVLRTAPPGRLIVRKLVEPANDPSSFTFSGAVTGTIGHGQTLEKSVPPGVYDVSEAALMGFDLTSIACDDTNSGGLTPGRTTTFRIAAGETVTCTFTNTKRGAIVIRKLTVPAGSTQSFTFTTSFGAGFVLKHGESQTSAPLAPGSGYSVAETSPAGWAQAGAVCDDGSPGDEHRHRPR